jgi:hypothetical protein
VATTPFYDTYGRTEAVAANPDAATTSAHRACENVRKALEPAGSGKAIAGIDSPDRIYFPTVLLSNDKSS